MTSTEARVGDPSASGRTAPGSPIRMDGVANLRDLAGWSGRDGRVVRAGRVFRSAMLEPATPADLDRLAELRITTVVDLRTADERTAQPDKVPAGAITLVADVLADYVQAAPAQLEAVLTDPPMATEFLGGGKAEELLGGAYRGIVSLDSALAAYRAMFVRVLDEAAGDRALLFHCTTGKDRTGWGAASLLMLLGVGRDDVLAEYLLTNDQLLPALKPMFDRFAAGGGDPDVLLPVFGVREAYLRTAWDALDTTYGSIEEYFAKGLGIDTAAQDRLRQALLVDPG